ncbi:MAG: TonB-dependent receptor domain-containing protein, partial [Vitreimonas sp.]
MTLKFTKRTAARKSLLTGASVLAATAAVFTAGPAAGQEDVEEEEAIVVTGTRLVRQDFEAISPVTTVGSEQLELTATLTTDSLLNELPQIIPGNTRTSNNAGGFDFSTVDLRGLGPLRTLVLINGERVPVSSTAGAVDINTIPASLISRIEVVTGGASAVYGSDAMSGVVNFVLKDDYEGAEVNVTYSSELETGNAAEFEINGLVGGNFANGRGNMTAYASYFDRDKVLQNEYDYSRVSAALCRSGPISANNISVCDTSAEAAALSPGAIFAGGSGTPPWGWISNNGIGAGPDNLFGTADDTGNPFGGGAIGNNPGPDAIPGTADDTPIYANAGMAFLVPGQFGAANTDCNAATAGVSVRSGNLSFNDAGQLTPRFNSGPCSVPDRAAGSSRYNFAPDNFIMLPAERVALTTTGHYDITDSVRLNLLINYANSRQEVQLAPTPATDLVVTLTDNMQALIQANAPDLWTALQSRPNALAPFTIHRRMTEVGTRNAFFENNSFFFLTSLEGSLGENWDWNLGASYGQVLFNTRAVNSVNRRSLLDGLAGCQTVVGAPGGGDDIAIPNSPNCIPLDVFGPDTLTDPMVSFLGVNTYNDTIIEENRVTGFVRGDLFELPAGPIASVFGFEYRDTFAESTNDNEQRTGNIFGFNAVQDQRGSVDVYELYTEFAVPILAELPAAHYLGLEVGFRRSNYSSVGNIDTYKIGGEWAPVEWLRFRAVFNEATRAPNVFELFQAGDQGFPAYGDPCTDVINNGTLLPPPDGIPDDPAVSLAQCQADIPGYGGGFEQNNAQVEAFAFGNPNLTPETAETSTYGVVFTPDWFPVGDLRASIDYYDIEITDVIAAFNAQFFLNDCYQNLTPSSCANITRDPITGQVDFVNVSVGNQGALATSGYDIQLEWSVPIGPGQLTVNELYSILDSFSINGNELAGTTTGAIGGALPDYKSVLSVSYNVGDWTLFGRWSYVPEMDDPSFGFLGLVDGVTPEASYFDASVRWNVTDSFTLTANVDNLMDEYPPQTRGGLFSQANTDPQVYRVLGRTLAVSG